ncbi:YqeB family protein [Micromonospora psammae]|uniref:YqeB family protein n=1 Tax=Micromonospora sp. CPCC 205556 TaxID=3122398 RepID=UPI002FEFE825
MPAQRPGAATVVGGGAGELVVMWVGFPLLGAGAGWALTEVSGWLAGLRWVPWQGLFELVDGLPDGRAIAGAVALGALLGLFVAHLGTRERLIVTVDRAGVRLHRDGTDRDVPRRSVSAVFTDRKDLVVLGAGGEELVREKSDLSRRRLRDAFDTHGWPWTEADPHRDAYRRWVEGLPGLPAGADALLRARQRAIESDRRGDALDLRAELARLGVVLRDEEKRQYWRLVPVALPGEETPDGR